MTSITCNKGGSLVTAEEGRCVWRTLGEDRMVSGGTDRVPVVVNTV